MATPNVITKGSPNMQRTGYGLRLAKIDGDAKGRVRQVSVLKKWATV